MVQIENVDLGTFRLPDADRAKLRFGGVPAFRGEQFEFGVFADENVQTFRGNFAIDFVFENFERDFRSVANAEDRVRKFVAGLENSAFRFPWGDVLEERLCAERDGQERGKACLGSDAETLRGKSRFEDRVETVGAFRGEGGFLSDGVKGL